MGKSRKKVKPKRPGRFFMVHHEMFDSDAYRSLDCKSRCLLHELIRLYVPGFNEEVFLSVRDAATRICVNKDTVGSAFHELADRGFIVLLKHHIFIQRKCRKWRLTFEAFKGREPTDDWRSYALCEPKPRDSLTQSRGQSFLEEAAKAEE